MPTPRQMAHRTPVAAAVALLLTVAARTSLATADASTGIERSELLPGAAIETASGSSSTSDQDSGSDFYLRMSAGAGVVGIDMHPEPGVENYSADGSSLAVELLAGTSFHHRAALGGALFYDLAPSLDLASSTGRESAHSTVGIGLLGPFVDAFPEPSWGLHFGASLGVAALSVHPAGVTRHPLYGIGGAAWAGKQFLVGKNWSLGGVLRVVNTVTGDEANEFDFEASCLATSLMLTAVRQ